MLEKIMLGEKYDSSSCMKWYPLQSTSYCYYDKYTIPVILALIKQYKSTVKKLQLTKYFLFLIIITEMPDTQDQCVTNSYWNFKSAIKYTAYIAILTDL